MRMVHAWVMFFGLFFVSIQGFSNPAEGFVQRDGSRLHINGTSFYFNGANQYYLFYKSQKMTNEVLEDAASLGLNTIRTWAFCDGEWHDGHSLQPSPRQYNDASFKNLDYAIYRAEQLGIRLIFSLTNNWDAFGGMNAYIRWTRSAREHDDFYSNPEVKSLFKDYIRYVLNRRNSYTGRLYKEEPAILMWELANEPRIAKNRLNSLYSWIDEIAGFIKSEDPNHLVSTGSEGDLDADLYQSNSSPYIDVVSFHLYPEDWNLNPERSLAYIEKQIKIAKSIIKKPVYAGEFGLRNKSIRESSYREWYQKMQTLEADGAMFWLLSGHQDDGTLYPDYDGFTLYYPESGSILDLVKQHSDWTKQKSGKTLDFDPPNLEASNLEDGMTIQGTWTVRVKAEDEQKVARVSIDFGGVDRDLNWSGEDWTYTWNSLESLDGEIRVKIKAEDIEGNETSKTMKIYLQNGSYQKEDWSLSGKKEQDDGYNFIYHLYAQNSSQKTEEGHYTVRFYLQKEGSIKIGSHYDESDTYNPHPQISDLKVFAKDVEFFDIDLGWRSLAPGESIGFKGQLTQNDGQFNSLNDWTGSDIPEIRGSVSQIQWFKDGRLLGGKTP